MQTCTLKDIEQLIISHEKKNKDKQLQIESLREEIQDSNTQIEAFKITLKFFKESSKDKLSETKKTISSFSKNSREFRQARIENVVEFMKSKGGINVFITDIAKHLDLNIKATRKWMCDIEKTFNKPWKKGNEQSTFSLNSF